LLPPEKSLPAPGLEYFEIETAKLHGGWGIWIRLPVEARARLLAHEFHKNMREHYQWDMRKTEAGSGVSDPGSGRRGDAGAPWSDLREKFFGKGCRNVGVSG